MRHDDSYGHGPITFHLNSSPSQPLHSTISFQFLSSFNYPHLISLAAAAYARTRKPEDQGDIFFFSKAHTFNGQPVETLLQRYKPTQVKHANFIFENFFPFEDYD